MTRERPVRVLFVCMGNICRSPTAEAVFRKLVADAGLADAIETDSAGTIRYHHGKPPDERAQRAASRRGYDMSDLVARQVSPTDFPEFDYIVPMDVENRRYLEENSHTRFHDRFRLFMHYADPPSEVFEVPDPYTGDEDGFEEVLDLVEAAAAGLLERIRSRDLEP